ncbi:MAG: hypothetical protein O3A53_17465 [Acidobacteria bacterium]|nr:hypothetical protein [Acidobacteriota bacterium]MDA1236577.1 hypothetical protein [Acidobacteriota bacterium]
MLNTPLGSAQYEMHRDETKQVLHCQVGSTWLHYQIRALDDLHAMLVQHGDWMELGNKDEKDEPKPGTVEHWGRSEANPVKGWYGLRKGYRGRFASYVTPVLEALGKVEFEKRGRSIWVRAL